MWCIFYNEKNQRIVSYIIDASRGRLAPAVSATLERWPCGRLVSATRISRSPGRARWGLVGETFASGANATEAQRPVHFAGAALRRCHSSTAPRSGRRGFHWMFAGFGKLLELPREPHGEHGEGEPGRLGTNVLTPARQPRARRRAGRGGRTEGHSPLL